MYHLDESEGKKSGLWDNIRQKKKRMGKNFSCSRKSSSHRLSTKTRSVKLFRKHIDIILENGYEIVPEITKKHGQIEICFDDGFLGLYEHINMLKEYNIYIHVFIISAYLNKKNYINKKQLIELNKLSLLRFHHIHIHIHH